MRETKKLWQLWAAQARLHRRAHQKVGAASLRLNDKLVLAEALAGGWQDKSNHGPSADRSVRGDALRASRRRSMDRSVHGRGIQDRSVHGRGIQDRSVHGRGILDGSVHGRAVVTDRSRSSHRHGGGGFSSAYPIDRSVGGISSAQAEHNSDAHHRPAWRPPEPSPTEPASLAPVEALDPGFGKSPMDSGPHIWTVYVDGQDQPVPAAQDPAVHGGTAHHGMLTQRLQDHAGGSSGPESGGSGGCALAAAPMAALTGSGRASLGNVAGAAAVGPGSGGGSARGSSSGLRASFDGATGAGAGAGAGASLRRRFLDEDSAAVLAMSRALRGGPHGTGNGSIGSGGSGNGRGASSFQRYGSTGTAGHVVRSPGASGRLSFGGNANADANANAQIGTAHDNGAGGASPAPPSAVSPSHAAAEAPASIPPVASIRPRPSVRSPLASTSGAPPQPPAGPSLPPSASPSASASNPVEPPRGGGEASGAGLGGGGGGGGGVRQARRRSTSALAEAMAAGMAAAAAAAAADAGAAGDVVFASTGGRLRAAAKGRDYGSYSNAAEPPQQLTPAPDSCLYSNSTHPTGASPAAAAVAAATSSGASSAAPSPAAEGGGGSDQSHPRRFLTRGRPNVDLSATPKRSALKKDPSLSAAAANALPTAGPVVASTVSSRHLSIGPGAEAASPSLTTSPSMPLPRFGGHPAALSPAGGATVCGSSSTATAVRMLPENMWQPLGPLPPPEEDPDQVETVSYESSVVRGLKHLKVNAHPQPDLLAVIAPVVHSPRDHHCGAHEAMSADGGGGGQLLAFSGAANLRASLRQRDLAAVPPAGSTAGTGGGGSTAGGHSRRALQGLQGLDLLNLGCDIEGDWAMLPGSPSAEHTSARQGSLRPADLLSPGPASGPGPCANLGSVHPAPSHGAGPFPSLLSPPHVSSIGPSPLSPGPRNPASPRVSGTGFGGNRVAHLPSPVHSPAPHCSRPGSPSLSQAAHAPCVHGASPLGPSMSTAGPSGRLASEMRSRYTPAAVTSAGSTVPAPHGTGEPQVGAHMGPHGPRQAPHAAEAGPRGPTGGGLVPRAAPSNGGSGEDPTGLTRPNTTRAGVPGGMESGGHMEGDLTSGRRVLSASPASSRRPGAAAGAAGGAPGSTDEIDLVTEELERMTATGAEGLKP
ncbi:hypothetical protein HYH03_006127 [Edaphochlamys debaryana]|uniref:Uncharacterized protein n=1 Tax=Edaphochlamys debaryana TaxID=47281 RepID=A0A835YE22_9CHLO|nr:hypothetical protein HYH03_006127 [Edaphochlamys debaryana]|eukprot:KAG2495889.1 hypothetical protein HYH03_006127 [Edaphochlamys debaryana]